eukprot:COSAG02_NODE_2071_length_9933_cov_5.490136_3_plen_585_part_00
MASHPGSATGGTPAPLAVALASVRRQRAALSRQRALISEGGHSSWPLETKLQRLRAAQSLAGEAAEATRVAQLLSDQILALEQDVRGELLYMHSLLCEELRENERKTEREAAKFRRRLLVGAARKRLQLLALFGEEEAGIRLLPHSLLLPLDIIGRGGAVSRSIAVPIPTIIHSGRSQVAKAAVVTERWNVTNLTLERSLVASCQAEDGSLRSWRAEGYVAVPSECIERFLLVGILCGAAAAQASMAGGPPSQRRVRGQLGQNRQAHCAELVSQAPEIALTGGPHACLAACLSECEVSITAAGEHRSDHMSGPTVGYAVRCSVVLQQSHHPPAYREGAVILSGTDCGSVECLAVSPHEVIMFVVEERERLGKCESAAEMLTVGTKITDTLREKASHRPPKGRGKHTGKHVDTHAANFIDETHTHVAETAAPQAASRTNAALQAGITISALPHCMMVTDVLGELHAEDVENPLAARADNGTADTANFAHSGSGTGDVTSAAGSSSASRGGWRVPAYGAAAAATRLESETSTPLMDGKSLQLHTISGRWQQAEVRLQQALRTASSILGSTESSLENDLSRQLQSRS